MIDAHLHCTGRETRTDVLQALDDAGIDIGVLLAPFLNDGYTLTDAASLRRGNQHLARLVHGQADRLVGFAVVNPTHPSAPRDLCDAVDQGLRGVKMVPSGWYPYDDAVQATFAEASRLQLPILFHSGIFIDGRSGRFCRPSFFEALRDHPGARVTLAHLGWPWTDEANAVGLIDRIHGVPDEDAAFRFDLSFGPPPPYRLPALKLALEVLGPGLLQYGSDCFFPCSGAQIAERRGWLVDLLDQLGVDAGARQKIFHDTAAAWLRLPGRTSATAAAEADGPSTDRAPDGQSNVTLSKAAPDATLQQAPASHAARAAHSSAARHHDPQPAPRAFWQRGWPPVCC